MIKERQKEQFWQFSGCCTADSQTDEDQNQLYNNLKISKLKDLAKPCLIVFKLPLGVHSVQRANAHQEGLVDVDGLFYGLPGRRAAVQVGPEMDETQSALAGVSEGEVDAEGLGIDLYEADDDLADSAEGQRDLLGVVLLLAGADGRQGGGGVAKAHLWM